MPRYEVEYRYTSMCFNSDYDVTHVGSSRISYETINSGRRLSRQEIRSHIANEEGCAQAQIEILNIDVSQTFEEEMEDRIKEQERERQARLDRLDRDRQAFQSTVYLAPKSSPSPTSRTSHSSKPNPSKTPTASYSPPKSTINNSTSAPNIGTKNNTQTSSTIDDDDKTALGYIAVAVVFGFFWVPKFGWFWGVVKSLFFPITLVIDWFF